MFLSTILLKIMLTNHSAQCLACNNSVVNVSYHLIIIIHTQGIKNLHDHTMIREEKVFIGQPKMLSLDHLLVVRIVAVAKDVVLELA